MHSSPWSVSSVFPSRYDDQANAMQSSVASAETRTLLEIVRWETYVELADSRRGSIPLMTYFEGMLELMNPRR